MRGAEPPGYPISRHSRSALAGLQGQLILIGVLLNGAGFHLMACLMLRVPELDFPRGEVWRRRGEGAMSG